jgi:hypothetical protein
MKTALVILLFAAAVNGCTTKASARREADRKAFIATQQSAMPPPDNQQQQPAVWFRGDVRNQRVPWTEGLTLAQAIIAAHYTWTWDPRFISVTRQGEVYQVNPRHLLRGQEDPLLEPGDVVEVRH